MNKDAYFALLEDKFLTFKELSSVPVQDNGEAMVPLNGSVNVRTKSIDPRMEKHTGQSIYVRRSVADRLLAAQDMLAQCLPNYFLEVVYGYRHLSVQHEAYMQIRERLCSEAHYQDDGDLKEAVHRYIAVPEVSGHPTGGAVDIRITDDDGVTLDMGTQAHEFTKDSYVFSPFVTKGAWRNRQILRYCMMSAGFAPFDGEWWHFSYGDREWARYYSKPSAIYAQIEFMVT